MLKESTADTKANHAPHHSLPATSHRHISADPIFAAIDAHRRAWAEFEKAVDVEQALECRMGVPNDIDRKPQVKLGERVVQSRGEIDAALNDYVRAVSKIWGPRWPRIARRSLEEDRKRLRRELEADARAVKRRQDATGWTAMREGWEAAHAAHLSTLKKLTRMKPTTAAGVAALATYAAEIYKEQLQTSDAGSAHEVLLTIARAAERMARHN